MHKVGSIARQAYIFKQNPCMQPHASIADFAQDGNFKVGMTLFKRMGFMAMVLSSSQPRKAPSERPLQSATALRVRGSQHSHAGVSEFTRTNN
jgi:hypothetical protein